MVLAFNARASTKDLDVAILSPENTTSVRAMAEQVGGAELGQSGVQPGPQILSKRGGRGRGMHLFQPHQDDANDDQRGQYRQQGRRLVVVVPEGRYQDVSDDHGLGHVGGHRRQPEAGRDHDLRPDRLGQQQQAALDQSQKAVSMFNNFRSGTALLCNRGGLERVDRVGAILLLKMEQLVGGHRGDPHQHEGPDDEITEDLEVKAAKEIPKRTDHFTRRAWFDFRWPMCNRRYANATIGKTTLDPAKWT